MISSNSADFSIKSMHAKREFAHSAVLLDITFCSAKNRRNVKQVVQRTSNRRAAICQHRYPSPRRSAPFRRRPTPPSSNSWATIRTNFVSLIASRATDLTLKASKTSTEGIRACQNQLQSHLQPSQRLGCQVALKPTVSARLSARPAAALQTKSYAMAIASTARLSAQLAARSSTTSQGAKAPYNPFRNAAGSQHPAAFCVSERPLDV